MTSTVLAFLSMVLLPVLGFAIKAWLKERAKRTNDPDLADRIIIKHDEKSINVEIDSMLEQLRRHDSMHPVQGGLGGSPDKAPDKGPDNQSPQ